MTSVSAVLFAKLISFSFLNANGNLCCACHVVRVCVGVCVCGVASNCNMPGGTSHANMVNAFQVSLLQMSNFFPRRPF